MHLTNYAINKNSEDFIRDDDTGSKRKLASINQWLEEHGYDTVKMWANIEVSESILPVLGRVKSCFLDDLTWLIWM